MNLFTHGLQITWPQGIVSMAFTPFASPFLQAGQILFAVDSSPFVVADSLKFGPEDVLNVTVMRDLSDSGWGLSSDDAGQEGLSFSRFWDKG